VKKNMTSLVYAAVILSLVPATMQFVGGTATASAAATVAVARVLTSEAACSPAIEEDRLSTNLADYRGARVPQYAKFEVAFGVSTTASNPYFPFDPAAPASIDPGAGISVDALLLSPGRQDWNQAVRLPCFYYQPVTEAGAGDGLTFLPEGIADWRCRFSPQVAGTWQYKIQATDACGTSESSVYAFDVDPSNRKGFVRVSTTDSRFFEFSDDTPFVTPLISLEQGNPLNNLARIRQNIPKLGQHGIRFVRWFPTGEGANYFVAPFSDAIRINWAFGDSWSVPVPVDTSVGKKFSYRPYFYSAQSVPAMAGQRYRLSFRAEVIGEKALRAQIGNISGGVLDICSATSTYHEAQGGQCDYKQDGWHDYAIEVTSPADAMQSVGIRGLYVSADAPSPFNDVQPGNIGVHSVVLQRYEGSGWGPNLLARSDPDTFGFVDQPAAARLDEIMRLSEEHGVYHKLPLFHKNDAILNRLLADGSTGEPDSLSTNFYSGEGQVSRWYQQAYARYFIARWSYSPALHSIELANENHLSLPSYDAGFALAQFVRDTSPRHILVSNSFWGYFVADFFANPEKGQLLDYGDKHWYASQDPTEQELISNTWADSAAYVRECQNRFGEYADAFDYRRPLVRGEGGVAQSGTGPQHPEIVAEEQGIYFHKLLWAQAGALGYTCAGEWYPRLFVGYRDDQFPNENVDLFKMMAAYERFMAGEPLNNGRFRAVGTDLTGAGQIGVKTAASQLRAWGVQSPDRALVWIDNAAHTWKNVADGVPIAPVSGLLAIPGFRPGLEYAVEWWDPYAFDPALQVTHTQTVVSAADGTITLEVADLASDVAVKVISTRAVLRYYVPVVYSTGTNF
jgi:hypothetical protein